MSRQLRRLAVPVLTLAIGVVIGWAVSQASRDGWGVAQAAKKDNPAGEKADTAEAKKAKRYGSVIGVKRETLERYVELHKAVWPGVLKQIRNSNIRNYSIYLGELDDGNLYLFSYFEYIGDDFEADMKAMAKDPTTQKWWKETDPLQIPQKKRKPGEHWMTMEEVFHTD